MKVKSLSFENQLFYVGIDVHLRSWTITIRCSGIELKTFKMEPIPEQLAAYLNKNFPHGIYKRFFCVLIKSFFELLGYNCTFG
jgi:hypothetical protein